MGEQSQHNMAVTTGLLCTTKGATLLLLLTHLLAILLLPLLLYTIDWPIHVCPVQLEWEGYIPFI